MLYKKLGNTGIEVSSIGLGTVKFGRNQFVKYPTQFNLPTNKKIQSILTTAKELGINVIDTAPAYGSSETRIGDNWIGAREDWILITKTGEEFINNKSIFNFSSKHTIFSIHRSLKRLRTEYLDIVLVHSNGDDLKIINESPVLETLLSLKQAGKIRAIGVSTKTPEGGKRAIDLTDCAMVTMNPLSSDDKSVINYAQTLNKGIFIKKSLMSGHIDKLSNLDPISESMRYAFATKGVHSVITGTLNESHLQENVTKASEAIQQIQQS